MLSQTPNQKKTRWAQKVQKRPQMGPIQKQKDMAVLPKQKLKV